MSDYEEGLPKVFVEKQQKARIDHECCECKRVINKGEKYFVCKGLWNESWDVYKQCNECNEVAHRFMSEQNLYPLGSLLEELINCEYVVIKSANDDNSLLVSLADWIEITNQKPLRIKVKHE
jgi:hypothetical protein